MIDLKHVSRIFAILLAALSSVFASTIVFAQTPSVETLSTVQLSGPLGGALALAFGSGCIAGYGFCVRTVLRISNTRITNLEGEMRDLRKENEAELRELRKNSADALREEKASCDRKLESFALRQRELEDMLLGRRPVGMFSTPVFVPDQDMNSAIEKLRKEP